MIFAWIKHCLTAVFVFAVLGTTVEVAAAETTPAPASALEGEWTGTLVQAADKLSVVVRIQRGPDGSLSGSISGLDQDAFAIDTIEREGAAIRLAVGAASGGFAGTLSDDGTRLTGVWSQLAITTPLDLTRSAAARSPPPAAPPH